MGFSTARVDVAGALQATKGWRVVSAGVDFAVSGYKEADGLVYFKEGVWPVPASEILFADKVDDADRVFFRLRNGCFVEVEKES